MQTKNWRKLLFCVVAANAADADFLPGLFVGDIGYFHHKESHGVGFFVIFALVVVLWIRFAQKKGDGLISAFTVASFLYFSHIVIDFFTFDKKVPYGLKFFWPFSNRFFVSPAPLFLEVLRGDFNILFGRHNLTAMAIELAVFLPAILAIRLLQRIGSQ